MRTVAEVLQALLDTLPKCHACEQPATRMMMSSHVPIPQQTSIITHTHVGGGGVSMSVRKSFHTRPYSGPSMGAQHYTPTDGTWQWDCCDDHPMPEDMKPLGSWDKPHAAAVRDALAIMSPKGEA